MKKKTANAKQATFDGISDEEKDFFVRNLEKKNRNLTKKLKEIENLEEQQSQNKELKKE